MITDFNPLDLSAPPKKIEEQAPEPAPVFHAKPTVKRVSMGPIFHSRITKVLALILGTALAVLLGYSGMTYYLTKTNQTAATQSRTSTSTTQTTTGSNSTSESTSDTPTADNQSSANQSTSTTNNSNNSTGTTNNNAQASAPCGVSGMPEGVCTAITSIEKDGLKNNKYVTADTSKVPAGSTVQVDEASWSSTSGSTGVVNFTAVMSGKNYKGVGNLQLVDGTWKITSYTLT